MHRLLVICVVFTVFAVHGGQSEDFYQNSLDLEPEENVAPKRCCVANKYELKAAMHSDTDLKRRGMLSTGIFMPRLSVDFTQKKIAVDEFVFNKFGKQNLTSIVDYNKGFAYVVMKVGKRESCKKFKVPGKMLNNCVPKDAKYGGSVKLGNGKSSLKADNWVITKRAERVDVMASALIQIDGCIPISEEIFAKSDGTVSIVNALYFDYSAGIKNPSVFNIPKSCNDAPEMDVPDMSSNAGFFLRKFTD